MSTAPQYKKLHKTLKRQILQGDYRKGSLLPSENQLSKAHKINRMTVRHALDELVKDGLITKKAGKGSIVTANRKSFGLLSLKGFSEVIGTSAHHAQTIELDRPQLTDWEQPFFYSLSDQELRNGCILMKRLRMADDVPILVEHTYFQNKDLSPICDEPLIDDSLFTTLLLNHQIEINNVEQDIRAVNAPLKIARLLGVQENMPLIQMYRKYSTSQKDFFIYSMLYCNTENYTIGNKF
jgi:GntR family transcriptional regulator/GntR family frlABCD operon transcriptional regulator